jgi:flavin reductase
MERLPTMSNTVTSADSKFSISADQYRAIMRNVPASVAIITSISDGQRNGLTATAVCSVSAEPAHILVCVNRDASTEVLIRKSGRFAVSYLQRTHEEISKRFSQSKLDETSRFAIGQWKQTKSGGNVLADAIAYLDCEVVSHSDFGTHSVFVGQVSEAGTQDGEPLVYCGGAYRCLS